MLLLSPIVVVVTRMVLVVVLNRHSLPKFRYWTEHNYSSSGFVKLQRHFIAEVFITFKNVTYTGACMQSFDGLVFIFPIMLLPNRLILFRQFLCQSFD